VRCCCGDYDGRMVQGSDCRSDTRHQSDREPVSERARGWLKEAIPRRDSVTRYVHIGVLPGAVCGQLDTTLRWQHHGQHGPRREPRPRTCVMRAMADGDAPIPTPRPFDALSAPEARRTSARTTATPQPHASPGLMAMAMGKNAATPQSPSASRLAFCSQAFLS